MWPGQVKKLPAFYETPSFITVLHTPILGQKNPAHTPLSYYCEVHFSRTVFSNLHPFLPGGLFSSGFDIKSLYAILLLAMRSTFPSYLIFLELVILVIYAEQYVLWSSLLNNSSSLLFLPPSVSKYSPLYPHPHPPVPFAPSSRSRLTVRDQVSVTRLFEILRL